ncbi:hypothetical protein BDP27DRAFT_411119 [Rhodocollybia butyracea]|uniref:C2H2-type domain-containing protein n=1 Tax=Rhodocollybia butyracea TaxID=206335 RepID=A0A9P5UAU9_9AGAR|nr:hypothetical protein BDP27DRAFT_411119 [Rhodocollybia butyracea]
MSRNQLQPLQLNSLPRAHEHDEYTARPSENRSFPSWNTATSSNRSEDTLSPIIDQTPGLPLGLSRPLNAAEEEKLAQLDRLKFFLATAPSRWDTTASNASSSSSDPYLNMGMGMNGGLTAPHVPAHPALNRFLLPTQEYVTCVLWNGLYHITGTDIVRALVFRFEAFGRPVRNMKKFEEGVFSDLRNLKPGQDASLEEPKSPFLDLLFKYQCIRTQKKQKVFYWFSVPHDRLFLDALERDLKREKMGLESTTQVVGEPALSFVYDGAFKRSLYEQFVKATGGKDGEGDLERVVRDLDENGYSSEDINGDATMSDADNVSGDDASDVEGFNTRKRKSGVGAPAVNNSNSPFFNMFSLFEGSPTYKQRRKKTSRPSALSTTALASTTAAQHGSEDDVRGRYDMRTINGAHVDRYTYPPSGEQYTSYPSGNPYGYHPSSSPPGTTQFNRYGLDVAYAQGYAMNSDTGIVRVKQEPVSAADMFIQQARGELPNAAGPTPTEVRAMKRHSYAGTDTTSVPVWLEGKFAGVGMAATAAAPPPPFANRARTMDEMMDATRPSPYVQPQQDLPNASPYVGPSSMAGSPPRSSANPSPRNSPPTSNSSPAPSMPTAAEASAAFPNPITIPSTSPAGTPMTTKAYACPLLSCGRLFKRMEHLKRHLRTHTMERPFVCTKEGCGKRFSRSDNLGQHLRVCRGGKSESDSGDVESANRVTSEGDSLGLSGMEWGVNVGEWLNSEMDDDAQPGGSDEKGGSDADNNMQSQSQQHPKPDIARGLNMFGGSEGLGMGMGMATGVSGSVVGSETNYDTSYDAYESSIPNSGAPLDVPMELCEVELTGHVRDVQGDEEGLVVHVRNGSGDEGYYTGESNYNTEPPQNADAYSQQRQQQPIRFYDPAGYVVHHPHHHSSLDSHLFNAERHLRAPSPSPRQSLDSQLDAQSQWAMRGASPAFSTISVPPLSPNRNSWSSGSRPRSSFGRHSNGSSIDGYGGDDASVSYSGGSASLPIPTLNSASASAPSHKVGFDHNSMYPPGMLLEPSFAASMGGLSVDSSTGGGPVRRHRSMTPSLMRGADGGFVRRPASNSGDNAGTSVYHPYASSSRASSLSRGGGSVHSSPAGSQLPLPGMGMQRSESRASRMMSRPGSTDPSGAANYRGETYRTDSPLPFTHHNSSGSSQVTDSPGTFVMDLPGSSYQQPSHLHSHAATVPPQFGMDERFSAQNGSNGYYAHHVSTL